MNGFFDAAINTVDRPDPVSAGRQAAPFWRKDEPVLENGRVVLGGFWKPQLDFWNLPNFIKGYVGGYGAGKTYIGGKWAIAQALHNAPVPVAAVSPTFPLARRTMIPTIKALLAGKQTIYGDRFWWRYNASYHEFTIRFKGREGTIQVYSGEDPDSLRGPNLAGVWLDEPFIMALEVFEQMNYRVRHPDARKREMILTGTPEQLNWGYDLFAGDLKSRYDVGMVQTSTESNKALPADYLQRLLSSMDPRVAQAYVHGAFLNLATGTVYYQFDPLANVAEIPAPAGAEYGVGMDFNVNPMSAVVFWKFGNHIHYVKEYELSNADTEYMCQTLHEDFPRLAEVYPDASGAFRKTSSPGGKTDFWYIRSAGFNINSKAGNPLRKDRYNAANGKLKKVRGESELTISPRCSHLIKYLSIYSHELMTKQQNMSHLLDAFSYPLAYLYPIVHETIESVHLSGV